MVQLATHPSSPTGALRHAHCDKGSSRLQRAASGTVPARHGHTLSQIQSKRAGASPASAPRNPVDRGGSGTIQRDPWDAAAAVGEQNATQNQNARLGMGVAAPHPVQIGAQQDPFNPALTDGQERHFDPEMLATVQAVLNGLPASHVIGNPALLRVVMEHGAGISYFGNNQLNVVVPGDVDSWIYLSVSKWPLGDLATTLITNDAYAGMAGPGLPGPKYHAAFGRDVVGTGTIANKLSMMGDNFVEWMLKHETGHSVDSAIGWTAGRHYRDPNCGGWMVHDGTDAPEANLAPGILGALLTPAQLGAVNPAFVAHTGAPYQSLANAVQSRDPAALDGPPNKAAALAAAQGAVPGTREGLLHAERVVREGLDSPWQKGGKGGIPLGNRSYHVEYQHNRWVSYDSAKYPLRNSNYQYSGPDEWFAESYAAYFKHSAWKFWRTNHGQWGEHVNDPQIQQWFLANLDAVNNPGAQLVVGNVLQGIAGPAPALPGQNPTAAPTLGQRIAEALQDVTIQIVSLPVTGLFRVLSTAFGLTAGILKYLLYVPARMLFRYLCGLF